MNDLNKNRTASSLCRRRKIDKGVCIHSGCWEKAAKNSRRCTDHLIFHRKESNKLNDELRVEVLSHYGKGKKLKCCWHGCWVSHIFMLCLDHIDDNGSEERKNNKHIVGTRLYRILKRSGYPAGYQTLCMNHNMYKEFERRKESRR